VWIEVTAENGTTKAIYKIVVTVLDPATAPTSIVLEAVGSTTIGTPPDTYAAATFDYEGAINNWVTSTADKIKLTVTKAGSTTATIKVKQGTGVEADYTSGDNYTIASASAGNVVFTVTVTETNKADLVYTYTLTVSASAPAPTITWDGSFTEAVANDGTIDTSVTATLARDTWATSLSPLATYFTVSGVPTGLTLAVVRTSATVATFTLTGNASAHAASNSITNLSITAKDGAFTTTTPASGVTNYAKSDIGVTFDDPSQSGTPTTANATVAKTNATQAAVAFTLTSSNDGTWKVYDAITSGNEVTATVAPTFSSPTLTLTHASDIPAAIYYVSVTETSKTESGRLALTVGPYVAPADAISGAVLAAGTAVGSTKITYATSVGGGNELVYGFSAAEVTGLTVEDTITGSAFTSTNDIALGGTGNDKVGGFITLYEKVTATSKVVKYVSFEITNAEVKPPTADAAALDIAGVVSSYGGTGGAVYAVPASAYPTTNAALDTGATGVIAVSANGAVASIAAGAYKLATVHAASGAYVLDTEVTVTAAGLAAETLKASINTTFTNGATRVGAVVSLGGGLAIATETVTVPTGVTLALGTGNGITFSGAGILDIAVGAVITGSSSGTITTSNSGTITYGTLTGFTASGGVDGDNIGAALAALATDVATLTDSSSIDLENTFGADVDGIGSIALTGTGATQIKAGADGSSGNGITLESGTDISGTATGTGISGTDNGLTPGNFTLSVGSTQLKIADGDNASAGAKKAVIAFNAVTLTNANVTTAVLTEFHVGVDTLR
jgi:hypothetical protein